MPSCRPPHPAVAEVARILAEGYLRLLEKEHNQEREASHPLPHIPRGRAPFFPQNPLDHVARRAKVRTGENGRERPQVH